MYEFFRDLDRRWIFLLMFFAVTGPILLGVRFPEEPSPMVRSVFKAIDDLPDGSSVLMFDFDPPSKGELQPMAAAFTRHCAKKKHKLFFMTLWPQGVPMVQKNISMLKREFPDYEYGRDYVNLGFRPGNEGVIKVVVGDLKALYGNDVDGTSLNEIPMTKELKNIQQIPLIVNVAAGTPGAKEWVQYAASPYDKVKMVAGTTGVGAPVLYPYIPNQLVGVLGAIKAAAEYEQALIERYPDLKENENAQEGLRRMGPQLIAHMLMIGLIIAGNIIYFAGRSRGEAR